MSLLKDKVALVTGAGSGIGAAISEALTAEGCKVFVTDIDHEAAERQVASLTKDGRMAVPICLDVTNHAACVDVAKSIEAIDIVVNNAGVGAVGTILDTSPENLNRLMDVNVRGVFNVTRAFLPKMIKAKQGNIINIASVGGIVGIRDRFAYCTTKFAVVGMTKAMALDHGEAGIRVNCVCPGRVETPFVQERLREYPDPDLAYKEMCSTQLFGRMIRPTEVANAVLYLASDQSSMITGSAFMIDCGWTAGK